MTRFTIATFGLSATGMMLASPVRTRPPEQPGAIRVAWRDPAAPPAPPTGISRRF